MGTSLGMASGESSNQGRSLESSTRETYRFYERAEEINNTLTSPGREMGLGMEFALIVGTAVALFPVTFGAGARCASGADVWHAKQRAALWRRGSSGASDTDFRPGGVAVAASGCSGQ